MSEYRKINIVWNNRYKYSIVVMKVHQACNFIVLLKKHTIAAMLSNCRISSIYSLVHEIKYYIWKIFVETFVG